MTSLRGSCTIDESRTDQRVNMIHAELSLSLSLSLSLRLLYPYRQLVDTSRANVCNA